jgi:hypothetical protein
MIFNINFLKKIKMNKSLTKIYFVRNEIYNDNANDIMKMISNTNINYIYLHKNKLCNFNNILRIIYRTKIIKQFNEDNNKNIEIEQNYNLTNLDISNTLLLIKNKVHITLLHKIINQTNLKCLDLSHILYGFDPKKRKEGIEKSDYGKTINNLKTHLIKDKEEYIVNKKEIIKYLIDINNYKSLENNKELRNYDKEILKIIEDEKSKYHIFLNKKANEIVNNNTEISKEQLVNYMKLKKAENMLNQFEEKKSKRKLIII